MATASCGEKSQLSSPQCVRHANQFGHVQPQNSHSGSNSRKRPAEGTQPEPKRKKLEQKRSDPVIVHVGSDHAAEMTLIVLDDLLYVWWYDREGTIQCSVFNFVEHLPRCLRLLPITRRFQNPYWGLNPDINPNFQPFPQSPLSTFHDRQGEAIGIITPELSSNGCRKYFGINGRATNIFPVTNTTTFDASNEDGLITAILLVEESCVSEPNALNKVYEIAEWEETVKGHVTDMQCYNVYTDIATRSIRTRLGIDLSGSRVFHVVVFHKLEPITDLYEDTFLHAWWETVKCHLALWKNGVHHRDISPSNLMYQRVEGKILGVLNDFDLASVGDGPAGIERIGTVPFMALALLEKDGLAGKIPHAYEHDAESFIWALIFITLRYENGKLRETDRPLDEWLKVDADTCLEKRIRFRDTEERLALAPGVGHEQSCEVAHRCLDTLLMRKAAAMVARVRGPHSDVDSAFQELLADKVEQFQFLIPPATN